jgi:hypothetical protein
MKVFRLFLSVSVFVLLVSPLFAGWSEPIHLSELNDIESTAVASRPTISGDGGTLYFVRDIPPLNAYLWEAKIDSQTGIFSTQRVVSELGIDYGRPIYTTWLSMDSLRLYASISRYNSWSRRWENPIYLAVRNNVESKWTLASSTPVISFGESDGSQSLTSDELLILWESRTTMQSPFIIYESKRSSTNESFVNFREVSELNAFQAQNPCMTSDGLCVYFARLASDGYYDLWCGFRNSLTEPFGSFELLKNVNMADTNDHLPCVSPDGKALYFYRGAPWMDASEKGIYVSYWLTNYEEAVVNLNEAIELKQQAQELINLAIEKETEAIKALSQVKPDELPAGVKMQDVRLARVGVLQAVQRQVIARMNINAGLELLNKVLLRIMPPVPVVQEEVSSETKRAVPEQVETKSAAARNSKK